MREMKLYIIGIFILSVLTLGMSLNQGSGEVSGNNQVKVLEYTNIDLESNSSKDTERSIKASELGILPNTNCASQLTKAVEWCYENDIDTIYFQEGDYYLESKVLLYPVNLVGEGFKELNKDIKLESIDKNNSYLTLDEEMACIGKRQNKTRFVFDRFSSSTDNDGWGYGFVVATEGKDGYYFGRIENIDWYLNAEEAPFIERNVIFVMLQINECKNVIIENCNFIVEGKQETSRVTELWFRSKNKENILVNNCGFINDNSEYVEYGTAGGKGGCLWIWGEESGEQIATTRKFYIQGCNFLTTCGDEAIAIWETYIDNVKIENCEITNRVGNSGNFVAFYDIYSNNSVDGKIIVNNLMMEINTACIYPFKMFSVHEGISIDINNLKMDFNLDSDSIPNNGKNYAVRSAIYLRGAFEKKDPLYCVNINGLYVRGAEERKYVDGYKALYSLVNASDISNCQISNADVLGDIGILFENDKDSKTCFNVSESKFESTRDHTTIAVPNGNMKLNINNTEMIECASIFMPRKESVIDFIMGDCLWIADYWMKGINYGIDEKAVIKSKFNLYNCNIISDYKNEFYYNNYGIRQEDVVDISIVD